ncbi:MAG: phosphoglucosamine mutase [Bdellovibrio sp. CG12_big_fil_rev_8_21_14_0_65_39_13]|nr:MAG: phosphoglucosamine mutase [Bdellovibrio sp. CG22_combo_CG10-13_8_21_14_all_39_27]PIQ62937.1 MAG: phosphoglucosamine mutase [Bdellovibrio sp. CG12_big_fil_rev_8_21_14_0_65_39_13]PIR32569.1 MAG: phosphoglucosamine mutase [Bdellovibrio sp. CG11_big_fil_rev_8_21_14_0_20_39_38]
MADIRKLFGTDGIRGKANVHPMTGVMAFELGRAVTDFFQKRSQRNKKPLIIVGKDTRLSCYMLEQAFSSGVCAQGGRVVLTGPLPTAGVAFVTKSMRADAGVMISASHNPYYDNGIKIFDAFGYKLPDEIELEIEHLVLNPNEMPIRTNGDLGSAKRLDEVFGRYLVHTKGALDQDFDMEGMRIVLDCANGAGWRVAPMMFRELGAEVMTLGVEPNGQNINLDCGSLHPKKAGEAVITYRADMGVCLDGDADRVVIIDEKGKVVDGDQLIGLFAKLLLDRGELKKGDTVVGTIMTNLGLENYLTSLGLKLERTQVGDRYIIEQMRKDGAILGGEPSGHIIFGRYATTGDGALAALKMVECLRFYNKKVSDLTRDVSLYPQLTKNSVVANKPPLEAISGYNDLFEKLEKEAKGKGRLVVRYSGTESLVRVMAEGEDAQWVKTSVDTMLSFLQKEIK